MQLRLDFKKIEEMGFEVVVDGIKTGEPCALVLRLKTDYPGHMFERVVSLVLDETGLPERVAAGIAEATVEETFIQVIAGAMRQ